jgi:hypothetical protein
MSGNDGIDSSTEVLAVRCTWAPVMMLCHARHWILPLLEDPALAALYPVFNALGRSCWGLGHVPSQGDEDLWLTDRW